MAKEKASKDSKAKSDEQLFAFLCYLISIIGVVLVLATRKDRKEFSIYHAKQGMTLFIAEIIVAILSSALAWIPFVGHFIGWILWAIVIVLWIVGMVNALNGKKQELPLIGQFGGRFRF